jgi:hypothetical protein
LRRSKRMRTGEELSAQDDDEYDHAVRRPYIHVGLASVSFLWPWASSAVNRETSLRSPRIFFERSASSPLCFPSYLSSACLRAESVAPAVTC